jgi:hypothetical protein
MALGMMACTNGQAELEVSTVQQAVFAAPSAQIATLAKPGTSLTSETELKVDVHDELASMAKAGPLTITFDSDRLSGADLSVVDHVSVVIGAADGTMPTRTLGTFAVPPGSIAVELSPVMPDAQLLEYLREGPVAFHFTLTGSLPDRSISLGYSLAAHVAIAVAGSVDKL